MAPANAEARETNNSFYSARAASERCRNGGQGSVNGSLLILVKTAGLPYSSWIAAQISRGEIMRNLVVIAVVLLTIPASAEEPLALSSEKAPQMIAVDLKLIEISQTKMRQLGFDFAKFDGKEGSTIDGLKVFDESPTTAVVGFVDALAKNKIAHVLAHPRIVTLSGRSANFSVNSSVSSSDVSNVAPTDGIINLGTELYILPVQTENNKITLDLRMKWSGLREDGPNMPRQQFRRYEVSTSIVSESGAPVSVIGQVQEFKSSSGKADEVLLLLIVTPELIPISADANPTAMK
jgi:hypothetical protein